MDCFKNVSSIGGDGIIQLGFDDDVPKHDPSGFYNWEQDNIPLWVLERRDDTLYQALGFPGGNPAGVTMTLSSTGSIDASRGIFDSIDDIIERIPKRLKFPVRVEICAYGNLGKLDLLNITCEGAGRVEIVNKLYAEDLNTQTKVVRSVSSSPEGARPHLATVSSVGFSSTLGAISSEKTGNTLLDFNSWDTYNRSFLANGPDTEREMHNLTVHVASGSVHGAPTVFGSTVNQFKFEPYGAKDDNSVETLDAAPMTGSGIDFMATLKSIYEENSQATLFGYGNYFSSIAIKDCQGTIKFTNICVDGASGVDDLDANGCYHINSTGWDIENSELYLDNCASIRNSQYGFFAKNSRIKSVGHLVAWRNYTKTDQNNRSQDGVGFLALNTDIEFDTCLYEESRKYLIMFAKSKYGLELRNSTLRGGVRVTSTDAQSASGLPNGGSQNTQFSSVAANGVDRADIIGTGGDRYTTLLHTAFNTDTGLRVEGSDVEFKGRIVSYLNEKKGVNLIRSEARLPQFTINHNGEYGLSLQNSNLTYGWETEKFARTPDNYTSQSAQLIYAKQAFDSGTDDQTASLRNRAQFHVDSNNQNILVDRASTLIPYKVDHVPAVFGKWGGASWTRSDATYGIGLYASSLPAGHYGATFNRVNNLPGILVTNNSTAEFVNFGYGVRSNDTGKGKVVTASNGSNLIFRGTSGNVTMMSMFPVNSAATQFRSWLTAAVLGTDNSTVEFTGPTKLSRFGVPILVEEGSNCNIKPPTYLGTGGVLDLSGYDLALSEENHTSMELHATRACLVANRKAGIKAYGIGGKTRANSAGTVSNSVDVLTNSYSDSYLGEQNDQFTLATSGGYIKFYPNAFTSSLASFSEIAISDSGAFNRSTRTIYPHTSQVNGTTGGMCVRAVGDSFVDVNLVNWRCTVPPKDLSGAFYNLYGSGCEYVPDTLGTNIGDPPGGPGNSVTSIDESAEDINPGSNLNNLLGGPTTGDRTGASESNWQYGRLSDTITNKGGTLLNHYGLGLLYKPVINSNGTTVYGISNPGIPMVGNERTDANGSQRRTYGRDDAGNAVNTNATVGDAWCLGSRIHIWNIADTSRMHAANSLINGEEPETHCSSVGYHGPGGKWHNGVALDYYGAGGKRTTYGSLGNDFNNLGIYRLMLSTRGDLKTLYGVSALSGAAVEWANTATSGGIPVDQVNGAGYMFLTQNVRTLDLANERRNIGGQDGDLIDGAYQISSCGRIFGWGVPAHAITSGVAEIQPRLAEYTAYMASSNGAGVGIAANDSYYTQSMSPQFPIPPIHMDWQGYLRHWFDETASNTWQNTKHLSEDKVNGVSIYRSVMDTYAGGEGRDGDPEGTTFGAGVRSLNLFDLDRLL